MRILTRYILREVASHAAIGVAVFTFVIFMRDLGKIMELVVRNSAPLPSVAEIFAYTLPTALTLTIPMGVLVGILIALSRLSADSEVTAMRSAGLGAWTLVRMIAVFFIGAWLLAMFNNLYLAPRSAAALSRLQDRLRSSQASFEIQPRVFYEDLPNYVLYVQDASSAQGKAVWRGIFLGDVSTPGAPKVTLARSGIVVAEAQDRLRLHLLSGSQHETVPRQSEQYSISTFAETDIPVQMAASAQRARETAPATEASTGELIARASQQKDPAEARSFRIEFHRRLALPTSCIVLALVGIPLGLSAKKGGRSTGFVLTILLVFIYYAVSLSGISLSRQGKMPPWAGLWLANAVFFVGGLVLLYRVDQMPIHIPSWRVLWTRLRHWIREPRTFDGAAQQVPQWRLRSQGVRDAFKRASHLPPLKHGRFPMILDDLIVRNFFFHLAMILSTFLMLLLVFTFFELLRDIIRNRIVLALVGKYLISLIPYLFYNLLPMSVLLAVLVTFGLMQKANEITAIKATGISIYRAIAPVLVLAGILAAGMFLFDQFYLPQANKRQDALRNQIKGKAAQTYLRPERKWIFGTHSNIYYYEFFDPDQNRFASLQAFEIDPQTFALTRRIYATRAHWEENLQKWVFEQGWVRSFQGSAIREYRTFDVATFPDFNESPYYFKKEVKQSSEMSYGELRRYIDELQQSGFDVIRLRVQLQKKFAFPVITFVMAVLAVPFSLAAGRRGTLAGVATAIGIAVVYWVTSGLFEAMGNTNQLPPVLAAWSPDVLFALAGGYLILKVPT